MKPPTRQVYTLLAPQSNLITLFRNTHQLLRIPETVPFRLTRNVVDGMGPMGTDGIFSTAAELTMRVLREHSKALLTILSAIASDPLYSWSLSPVKANRKQEDADEANVAIKRREQKQTQEEQQRREEHNKEAANAISKVQQKLQGYEEGTAGEQQSVESQVQLLTSSARNEDNLCSLYVGWAPWV